MKYLIIFLAILTVSCLATGSLELGPGEEAKLYKKTLPGVTVAGKTIGGVYEEVVVSAPVDYTSLNVARRQEKALLRIEWGLGVLLIGTVVSAALKSYNLEFIGVYCAAIGGGMMIHGLFVAKIAEYWAWAGVVALILFSGMIAYLCHGKGIGNLFEKFRSKRNI